MFTSLSTALSALRANSTAFSVVGNNLANLNTPGYKASVVSFQDLVTRSIGAALRATEVGFGTAQPTTIRQFTQGAIQSSSGTLDAAIQGEGFFVIEDASGVTSYTRAGAFMTDSAGKLVTVTGERVQGWNVDPVTGLVDTNAPTSDIVVPVGSLKPPVATRAVTLDLNLNSSAAVTGDSDLSYPVQVFDSLGTSHVLTFQFTKTAGNTWTYSVKIPGGEVSAGTPGTPYEIATDSLSFDEKGQLVDPPAGTSVDLAITDLTSGAADLPIKWDLFSAANAGLLSQVSDSSEVSAVSQDGAAAAQLVRVGLSDGGLIVAQYSDEQHLVVAQLALAAVRNPDSLSAQGNNNYRTTAATATPVVGLPGARGRGKVVGASIEASTVDVATEFTNLIVYQRAYQANSKVVTSADQLSQETINLIR